MTVFAEYLFHFLINQLVLASFVIINYNPRKHRSNNSVALLVIGALVYVVITLIVRYEIGLGIGFGIFAIFSLLRFRTVAINLRDMTYLFAVVAVSFANAFLMYNREYAGTLAVALVLFATMLLLEKGKLLPVYSEISLTCNNLELLRPEQRPALLADLQERTGLKVEHLVVDSINLRSGTARIQVFIAEE
ncbi:MAG: DUF4956 domain-containing protein [Anaerolineaceae bacterium]|nr:DUF4956 domain-containing protein [Anaerolineaceae bacterium]MCY3907022.1 DUF4956 domain-containing protein [Anaerolineaceae bacterium]MDE0608763.1 DUF4956 domain-containing protein [Anaerolineaceae bacterium]